MITIYGVSSSDKFDDRTRLLLKVHHLDEVFDWEIRVPPTFKGDFIDYVNDNESAIYNDIESKLNQWENLDPKTQIQEDGFGDTIEVPILRCDIVKPTYPDYYALRFREYPSVSEQLDAIWKGGNAKDAMNVLIESIKLKYTKE